MYQRGWATERKKDVLRKKGEFEKVYIQKFMCSAIFRIKDCSRGSVLPQRLVYAKKPPTLINNLKV